MEIKKESTGIFEGENDSRALLITVDDEFAGYEIRLAFLTPSGFRCITPEIKIKNGEAKYFLPASLFDAPGRLLAQIVAENEEQRIVKSEVFAFDVEKSVAFDAALEKDGEIITLMGIKESLDKLFEDIESYAHLSDIPTKTSDLFNDSGFLTQHQDISGKQDKLIFDDAPTENSVNPVTSNGIYTAL